MGDELIDSLVLRAAVEWGPDEIVRHIEVPEGVDVKRLVEACKGAGAKASYGLVSPLGMRLVVER